jgi:hypothetical protein
MSAFGDSVEKVENIAATEFAQKRADRQIRLAMSLKASANATGWIRSGWIEISGWKRPFDDPITLSRGRQLVTLTPGFTPSLQSGSLDPRSRRGGCLPATNSLRLTEEVRSRNLMVNADLSAAKADEVLFSPIGGGAVEAISLLVVVILLTSNRSCRLSQDARTRADEAKAARGNEGREESREKENEGNQPAVMSAITASAYRNMRLPDA